MTAHRTLLDPSSSLRRSGRLATLLRYGAVSGVATSTSLVVLGVLVGVVGISATMANVLATTVGTVPSFELNRRWVWAHTGRRSIARQVLPFAALSFAGLVLSTLSVRLVSTHTASLSRTWHTLAVEVANIAAYGALWVIQFVILDRVLFRHPVPPVLAADPPGELVGAGRTGADES
jgi:putative flippase GtrA